MSTSPRNCPTDPSHTFSARMIAAKHSDASAMMPNTPQGEATENPSASEITPNSAAICATPRMPGVSHPASVILSGEASAVASRARHVRRLEGDGVGDRGRLCGSLFGGLVGDLREPGVEPVAQL